MDELQEVNSETKFCKKCKKTKSKNEFHKYKGSSDGLYAYCKECNKKKRADWYAKNKDIVSQKGKIHRIENHEKILKRSKELYRINAEKNRANAKKYREKNKDEINRRRREELRNNPEKRELHNLRTSEWCKKNAEYLKKKKAEYNQKNKDKVKEAKRIYAEKHKEYLGMKRREWYAKNKDNQNEKLRKKREDITKRININISAAIRHSIRNNKSGRHWEDLVGYTVDNLKEHLESQFIDKMDWECYMDGKIHIDHKIPLVAFDFISPDDENFKKAWSLKNLQPLWATENLSKGEKILYPELYKELIGYDAQEK